jgi:hypothetical protein
MVEKECFSGMNEELGSGLLPSSFWFWNLYPFSNNKYRAFIACSDVAPIKEVRNLCIYRGNHNVLEL